MRNRAQRAVTAQREHGKAFASAAAPFGKRKRFPAAKSTQQSENTVPKSEVTILAQLRATADLAAAAAMDISRLNERFEAIEGVNDEGSKGTYAASERKHILDRMEVLRSYLSIVPATSALGALAQLSEIDATLDAFFANEHDEYQEAEVARRVRRLVYSIYAFFSQQVAPDELAKAWPIGDYLDPWKPFEQQVTIIEERAESQGQQRAA